MLQSRVRHRCLKLWKACGQTAFRFLSECGPTQPCGISGFSGGCFVLHNEPKKLTPALCYIDQTYLSGAISKRIVDFKLFTHAKDTEFFYPTFEQQRFVIACSPISSASVGDKTPPNVGVLVDNRLRQCVGTGIQALQRRGITNIFVDPSHNAEAAAEGAYLAAFVYDELKATTRQTVKPNLMCYTNHLDVSFPSSLTKESVLAAWDRGRELAQAQNLARKWMETPANLLSPMDFASQASSLFEGITTGNVRTHLRNEDWCRAHGMNGLLAVSAGSHRSLAFLELIYEGDPSRCPKHVALVGKGVTFDAGGISIKPSSGMEDMRADMGGAAVVVATVFGLARLRVPINIRAYIPLCENMPGGGAMRPGDVIRMANGTTVQVNNTDAEGRLLLADAIHIACKHPDLTTRPSLIVDVATLTGAISVALGEYFTGIFTNRLFRVCQAASLWKALDEPLTQFASHPSQSPAPGASHSVDELGEQEEVGISSVEQNGITLLGCLHSSSVARGENLWRLPLTPLDLLHEQAHLADMVNVMGGSYARQAGSCMAASFLYAFVPRSIPWIHFDIAGVMKVEHQTAFMRKGMSGCPTRTLIEFLQRISQS